MASTTSSSSTFRAIRTRAGDLRNGRHFQQGWNRTRAVVNGWLRAPKVHTEAGHLGGHVDRRFTDRVVFEHHRAQPFRERGHGIGQVVDDWNEWPEWR